MRAEVLHRLRSSSNASPVSQLQQQDDHECQHQEDPDTDQVMTTECQSSSDTSSYETGDWSIYTVYICMSRRMNRTMNRTMKGGMISSRQGPQPAKLDTAWVSGIHARYCTYDADLARKETQFGVFGTQMGMLRDEMSQRIHARATQFAQDRTAMCHRVQQALTRQDSAIRQDLQAVQDSCNGTTK